MAALAALGLSLVAIGTARAKDKDRVFVGCVEKHNGKYELVTTSVKARPATTRSSAAMTSRRTWATASGSAELFPNA